MAELFLAPAIVFAVLTGWVGVEWLYARFQARHPQLGPFRNIEAGCTCCRGPDAGSCSQDSASEQGWAGHAVPYPPTADTLCRGSASSVALAFHRKSLEPGRQEGGAPLTGVN